MYLAIVALNMEFLFTYLDQKLRLKFAVDLCQGETIRERRFYLMRDFVCILSTYVCTQWFRRKLFFFIPFFAPIFIPTLFRIVSWTLRIAFFYIHIRAGCTRALFSRTAPFLLREDPRPEPSFGQICELPIWNLRKSAQADFPQNLANFASRHTSILA